MSKAHLQTFGPFFSGLTPMSAMHVYSYDPGTTDLKTIYVDYNKSATASNPINADANGYVKFYADGLSRFSVRDTDAVEIYDLDNVLVGPLQQPSTVSVHKNGTDQTSIPDDTWTKLTFSTETLDEEATFASDRWVPGRTGTALVIARGGFASVASEATLRTGLYLNSALVKENAIQLASAVVSGIHGAQVVGIIPITSTSDFIEVYVRQNTGGEIGVEGDAEITYLMGALLS